MLPYKRPAGDAALKRIRVYVGVPGEFDGKDMESLEEAHIDRLNNPQYVTLGTVSSLLGSKY